MALTKTQLKEILSAAGILAENAETAIGKIMDGHLASINALREDKDELTKEVAKYKADAEKLPGVQKELDALKAKGDPDWQKKYDEEHKNFESYKADIAAQKAKAEKVSLYRKMLKEDCSIDEKRIDAILKVTDIDGLSMKDGKLENVETLKADAQKEWADFVVKTGSKGAKVDNPPQNGGDKPEGGESRAAQLAAAYHESLYGKAEGD